MDSLFFFLWCKDEQNFGPQINIPDTIVYMYCQPAYWYFTSKDTGKIMRKNRYNLTSKNIEKAFTKNRAKAGCDTVAYFISQGDGKGEKSTIEYFDEDSLREFLRKRPRCEKGILQKFIEPKGIHNSMIRSIWSPKVCLLERRLNNRRIDDTRFDVYERMVTFEGNECNSHTVPVKGGHLPTQVQKVNEAIVTHVAEVSFHKHKTSRMVLNFRVDPKSRLWLLWCSSIRLAKDTSQKGGDLVDIEINLGVPKHVDLAAGTGYSHPYCLHKEFKCPSCHRVVEKTRTYPIPYKTVISHFDQIMADFDDGYIDIADPTGLGGKTWTDIERMSVPLEMSPVITQLHKKLALDDYKRYKHDPLFLYKTATVCEDCYLVYADVATFDVQGPVLIPGLTEANGFKMKPGTGGRVSSLTGTRTMSNKTRLGTRASTAPKRNKRNANKTTRPKSVPEPQKEDSLDKMLQTISNKKPSLEQFTRIENSTHVQATAARNDAYQEEAFFREVYRRPHVPKGDPLQHMVDAKRDIANAPTLPKVKKKKTLKLTSQRSRLLPYTTVQQLVVFEKGKTKKMANTRSRSPLRRAGKQTSKPSQDTNDFTLPSTTDPADQTDTQEEIESYTKSAEDHRDFLLDILKQTKDQLQQPSALLVPDRTT